MSTYTSSSLTLRALLKSAVDRLGPGARRVTGLTASAKAMYAAASASRSRTVLVVPTDAEVERATEDARFFLAALEGLADAEVERVVLPFPSHEVDPYRGLAPHFDIASARARALHALAAPSRAARLIVASAGALMPRISAPARLVSASLTLTPGQEISPVDLGDLLTAAGYARQDPVDESGEFCVRGGVVDFFPAGARHPIRLEFLGDSIESIRPYDAATQRSTGSLDQVAITPLQELIAEDGDDERPDRSATVFDYLWTGDRPAILLSEPDEIGAQGEKLTRQIHDSHEEATAKGHRVAPPGELIVDWPEVSGWLQGATALETLEVADGRTTGGASSDATHVSCQPALEFNGRVQDWVAEIRRGRERGDTVVFIAHSAGRAERTIELLADYDFFAVPI
jgi:transcription-repair coupling factor (superfamily II helicase)